MAVGGRQAPQRRQAEGLPRRRAPQPADRPLDRPGGLDGAVRRWEAEPLVLVGLEELAPQIARDVEREERRRAQEAEERAREAAEARAWQATLDARRAEIASCTVDDCESGYGAARYHDGRTWIGPFRDGLPHGQGVLERPGGGRFEGRMAYGVPRQGTMILPGRGSWTGSFDDQGRPHGAGELVQPDGIRRPLRAEHGSVAGFDTPDQARATVRTQLLSAIIASGRQQAESRSTSAGQTLRFDQVSPAGQRQSLVVGSEAVAFYVAGLLDDVSQLTLVFDQGEPVELSCRLEEAMRSTGEPRITGGLCATDIIRTRPGRHGTLEIRAATETQVQVLVVEGRL